MKTYIQLAIVVAAGAFVAVATAATQETVVNARTLSKLKTVTKAVAVKEKRETAVNARTLSKQTGWWQYHNVKPEQLSAFVDQHKARIIDLDVDRASPLRLSATLVANSGSYTSGWWWYYGQTAAQVSNMLKQNKARLLDVDPYLANGVLRFAAVMVPNTGNKAVSWWWYYGQTPQQLGEKLDQHKARLVDIESYRDGNKTHYAAIMVSNQGPKATDWWWYHGQTAAQVTQRISQHHARLLDVERHGSGENQRFDIILVPNTGSSAVRWWWYYGLSGQQLLEASRRHGARLFDIEPSQDGASGYTGIMIDNGMTRNGDCGGQMANVDREVIKWMKKYNIPGAAAAIVKGDNLVYACAFGYANLKTGETVKPLDLFRLASISKPITSSAIRNLCDDGKLALSDKMLDHLGSAKPAEPYEDDRLKDITIQNLLDHKGGWNKTKMGFDPMFQSDQIASALGTTRPSSFINIIRYMFQNVKLSFAPGGGIDDKDYSNFGYCILGRIVEARGGKAYEKYVQDEILTPINITKMRIGKSLASNRFSNEVQYYDVEFHKDVNSKFDGDPKKVQRPDGGFHLEAMDAHGGWIASAPDIARFARFATGGKWSFGGSLPGTSTLVDRRGDVVVAVLFNTRPVKDLDNLIDNMISSVSVWPTKNLWEKYGYLANKEPMGKVRRLKKPMGKVWRLND